MANQNWLQKIEEEHQLAEICKTNEYTEKFGLRLCEEDSRRLVAKNREVLQRENRWEFGEVVQKKLIYAFCDSNYVTQDNYVDTIERLTEMFFLYKNEMQDEITDDELIAFMREQFDEVCNGDLDYLESTCLDIFARAIRAGYRGYEESGGYGEYGQFDLLPRWSREEYLAALNELCQ